MKIATNCLNTLAQLAKKKFSYFHENVYCTWRPQIKGIYTYYVYTCILTENHKVFSTWDFNSFFICSVLHWFPMEERKKKQKIQCTYIRTWTIHIPTLNPMYIHEAVVCGGNGVVLYLCVSVCLLLSFSLSNSFFCALWCSIQVIVHVHVYTCTYVHAYAHV